MRKSLGARVLEALRAFRDIYEELYFAPYRQQIHKAYRHQHDLFLLLTTSDMLGVPNPVEFYTLELLPEVMEEFHQWHLRLGMEQPPEGGFRCC